MEKYFIVTERSNLYKEYHEWINNGKIINEHVKEFMSNNNIQSNLYHAYNDCFCIVPTEDDVLCFNNVLGKSNKTNKLRPFKKNSSIGKAWTKSLTDNNLKVLRMPHVPLYFNVYGKSKYRLFDQDNVIYCSFKHECNKFEIPMGFTEIKASEFYKIIED